MAVALGGLSRGCGGNRFPDRAGQTALAHVNTCPFVGDPIPDNTSPTITGAQRHTPKLIGNAGTTMAVADAFGKGFP
ncbi:hypothetical protein GCM10011575_19430 [Microlunatus endophyticus]|uniref:Uncharacterized protein n=1 Tax=Microlunatus endophyticus TaxID=1716077 RepID=A0A917W2N2_9ACTN|nr:hypothetical protein GCM10011575_19430 [Microlunatus endophyticus]